MSSNERRGHDREMFHLPIRFRAMDANGNEIYEGESLNVSPGGIFFATAQRIRKGQELEMFMTLPSEMTGREPMPVRCEARVVHVKKRFRSAGFSGIGARFLRSEPTIEAQKRILASKAS